MSYAVVTGGRNRVSTLYGMLESGRRYTDTIRRVGEHQINALVGHLPEYVHAISADYGVHFHRATFIFSKGRHCT
jgi:hypothetical protein